jgi:hypothetical protein
MKTTVQFQVDRRTFHEVMEHDGKYEEFLKQDMARALAMELIKHPILMGVKSLEESAHYMPVVEYNLEAIILSMETFHKMGKLLRKYLPANELKALQIILIETI